MEIMENFYFLERDRTILFNTKQLRSEKQSFQHRELQQHNHKLFFVKKSAFNKKYKIYIWNSLLWKLSFKYYSFKISSSSVTFLVF